MPRRDSNEARPGAVYGIPCLAVDKATGIPLDPPVVIVGYIGQSRQTVKQREEQHRDGRFGDVIVGGSFTIVEGKFTDEGLDRLEEHYIRAGVPLIAGKRPQRPVYNYDYNTNNPDRIEVWRAVEHRQRRQPGWMPGESRVPQQRQPRSETGPGVAARVWGWLRRIRWTPRRKRYVIWSAVWLAAAVPSGVWLATQTDIPTGWSLLVGAAAASALVGYAMPKTRRHRKRSRR